MLSNENEPDVQKKIAAECEQHPCLGQFIEAVKNSPHPFRVIAEVSGLTLAADNEIDGQPNRGIFKVFFPEADKLIAIFYKKSLVSFSRDRYSYGGIAAEPERLGEEKIDEWLEFLHTGFDPEKRPTHFQRTFPYDLPDD